MLLHDVLCAVNLFGWRIACLLVVPVREKPCLALLKAQHSDLGMNLEFEDSSCPAAQLPESLLVKYPACLCHYSERFRQLRLVQTVQVLDVLLRGLGARQTMGVSHNGTRTFDYRIIFEFYCSFVRHISATGLIIT